jgi:hypothetical protein
MPQLPLRFDNYVFMIYGHQPCVGLKILWSKYFSNFIGLAKIYNFRFCFETSRTLIRPFEHALNVIGHSNKKKKEIEYFSFSSLVHYYKNELQKMA